MMRDQYRERRICGLFYSAANLRCVAGHVRLFGGTPGRGWCVYTYNQMLPHFALHRVWNFGLIAIHHVGAGMSVDPAGWHLTFAKLAAKRSYRGLTVEFRAADTFRTRKT